MDRAGCKSASLLVPEERARVGQSLKDCPVIEEGMLVRINSDKILITGMKVPDKEPVISVLFVNYMDKSQVPATLTAPEALEPHIRISRVSPECLPDGKYKLHRDQDDDDPFETVRVLDPDLVG